MMAGKWFRSKVRKVKLDQLFITLCRKGNSSRVIRLTVVFVVIVFALNLVNVYHMETWSTRRPKREGQFENNLFFVHEADANLPVGQRGVVASYIDRGPPESILLRRGNKMAEDVSFGATQGRERRDYAKDVPPGLVRGDARRNIELGSKQVVQEKLLMEDGDALNEVESEKRKYGVLLGNGTRVNHNLDISSVRDTKRKPRIRTDHLRINRTKRKDHMKHGNTFNRRGKMQRYNGTFKERGRGVDKYNGHIIHGKTLNDILERRRQNNELIKNRDKLFQNDTKSDVLPLTEGTQVLNVANETAKKDKVLLHSRGQSAKAHSSNTNNINIRGNCARLVTIYTSSITPFEYWPEYSGLRRLFDDGKHYSGNIASSPTGYVVCPDQPCDINLIPTNDEAILAASDAVLLNVAPLLARPNGGNVSERLLKTLPKKAKIILYGMESANMMTFWDTSIRDIQFHYSMTYHSSSDLVHPYGRYIRGESMDKPDQPLTYTEGKTKILAWMASNCNYTFWPRYEWVSRLREFIQIDTYGNCGQVSCLPRFSEKCVRVMRSYKFYLALENTQCDEYITEKFWDNGLLNGVVPVVYGGRRKSYERIAPPGSFIYAADFASPKELADYLIMLDKDDDRYSEFFAWRKLGRVEKIYPNLRPTAFCGLLPLLSSGDNERVPVKRAADTEYFLGCREDVNARFIERGDINNWSPWK